MRPSGSRAAGRTLLAALLAATGACSFQPTATDPDRVTNACELDDQCPGTECAVDLGMCISPRPMAMRVGFDVLPASDPTGGVPVRTDFPEQAIGAATELDLWVQPKLSVVGVVRWGDERIPAEVALRGAPEFPGGPETLIRGNTLPDPSEAADGLPADYAMRVAAGETYQVTVTPAGGAIAELPPLTATLSAPEDRGAIGRADFVYPDTLTTPCEPGAFTGCTFVGQVVSVNDAGDEIPENGLRVKAIEIETGRTVSSTGETGPTETEARDDGVFSIRIASDAGPFVFRITGGDPNSPFPTVAADPALFFPGVMPARLLVPRLPVVLYRGFVEDTMGNRIPDATVSFRSEDVFDDALGVTGTFSATAATESGFPDAGRFTALLLPGTYEVVVSVPGESDLGVLVESVRVQPREDGQILGQVFSVPARSRLGGRVVTTDERLMAGADVQASPSGLIAEEAPAAAAFNRTSESMTDATGRFDLPLDIGTYDITVRPPEDSLFSWVVVPGFGIGNVNETLADSFTLESPVPVGGIVYDADGAPLPGATVRAFTILEDERGEERAVQIGEATSAEDGAYQMLLPPRLQ